jgi:hypothetical protein
MYIVGSCRLITILTLKTRQRRFAKSELAYWRRRVKKSPHSAAWHVEIQTRGERHRLSLDTANRDAAAAHARDIYQLARAVGWPAVFEKYRPQDARKEK